jgi:hypothetical protein
MMRSGKGHEPVPPSSGHDLQGLHWGRSGSGRDNDQMLARTQHGGKLGAGKREAVAYQRITKCSPD